jgi:HAD superfamily hydrolase (TIGR01509 family)
LIRDELLMPRPSLIVFDLGKVLVDFDYSIAARQIAARSNPQLSRDRLFSDHAPLLFRYEVGQITTEQFFEEMRAITGFSGSLGDFAEPFADIFTAIPPMVELHSVMRKQGFRTWIFSNTNPLAVSHIRHHFPFFKDFDGYIYSYEHGAMKPDTKLYEVLERTTKCSGEEIVYIDDRPENAAAGAGRGWRVVLHESPDRTRSALRAMGLLNDPRCRSVYSEPERDSP